MECTQLQKHEQELRLLLQCLSCIVTLSSKEEPAVLKECYEKSADEKMTGKKQPPS